MDLKLKNQMNEIYSQNSWEEIPWNFKRIPEKIRDYIESGKIKPGKTLDIGCGVGNYSNWLAENGFDVTGIDLSDKAIELAKEKYKQDKLNFICGDIIDESLFEEEKFDFIFDWQVLHHLLPEKGEVFVERVSQLLEDKGVYISVCFSEESKAFGGKGKLRTTFLNTELYFSSENEIRQLFEKHFEIKEIKTVEVPGKVELVHKDIFVLMTGKK